MSRSVTRANAQAEPSLAGEIDVKVSPADESKYMETEFCRLYYLYREIATNIFTYDGLPDECYPQYVERLLFDLGAATEFESSEGRFVMPIGGQTDFNYYWQPIRWYGVAPNGKKRWPCNTENAIYIRNTYSRIPTRSLIYPILWDMVDTKALMRTNRDQVKLPTVYSNTPERMLSAKTYQKQKKGNHSAIFIDDKTLMPEPPSIAEPKRIYMGGELRDTYNDYKSELLTVLGISNNEIDKAAQLTEAESKTNRAEIICNLDMLLQSRQQWCDEHNKRHPAWGKLSVSINNRYIKQLYEQGYQADEGGVEDVETDA